MLTKLTPSTHLNFALSPMRNQNIEKKDNSTPLKMISDETRLPKLCLSYAPVQDMSDLQVCHMYTKTEQKQNKHK